MKTWKIVTLAVVGVLALIVLPIGIWLINSAVSPVVGQVNVHRHINSAQNQQFQYEHFFALYGDIKTDTTNIQTSEAQLKSFEATVKGQADPFGQNTQTIAQDQSTVTGLEQQCTSLVNEYNNNAQEYTKAPFLSNSLPPVIQVSDPSTSCTVNAGS